MLRGLDNIPNNLQDLYNLLLTECQTSITNEQSQIAKGLFAWLAYSKRTLTREEAANLCTITASNKVFDVEDLIDDINSRSARYIISIGLSLEVSKIGC